MDRIGVFVCHCGLNIARSVDVDRVVQEIGRCPGVAHAEHYIFMCSEPGQELVKNAVSEKNLNAVILANCSPTLHETTFRNAVASVGLNPYRCEIANIREHCSWPHEHDEALATEKAIRIIKSALEKVRLNRELQPVSIPVTKKALVIGGGITGIQTALDIADGGQQVILVEKSPSIGGRMGQLSETFPTLDCPQCIMTPKMVACGHDPNIKIYAYSEVDEVSGYVGNFKVKIRMKASYVDREKCNGCGLCMEKCLTVVPNEWDFGLSLRKAIYTPFPQAVPNIPVIDREHCGYFTTGLCRVCSEVCPKEAIDYLQEDSFIEEEVGAVVVATGYGLYDKESVGEYERNPDVIDGLQFERILSPGGPTFGEVIRPSDWTTPKEIAFLSCIGSRDPEHGVSYCSKICCMYLAKQAMIYKHLVPDGQAYIFYMDIRSDGKGYEEFVQRGMEDDGILYLRGRVSKIFSDNGKVKVWGVDTLTGRKIEIAADLVVLGTAMVPSEGIKELASRLRIQTDEYGWLKEAHLKLRPVETLTSGIYIAGVAQSPKDITDSVAQGSGAASKVLALLSKDQLLHEPTVAAADEEVCTGCGTCERICAYEAVQVDRITRLAVVNEVLCEGCGACQVACPSGAMTHTNFSARQIMAMVTAATEDYAA